MKPIFRSNLFALIIILTQVIGSIILVPILKLIGFNLPILLVSTQVLFLIVPTVIYFSVTRLSIKDTLKFNKITLKEIFLIILIAFLSQPVAAFFSFLSSLFFPNLVAEVFEKIQSIPYVVMLSIMALTPAICEEVTVRGVILSGYEHKSDFKAAMMSGLIFGIFHLNAQQFLYAFALGVLFGYLVRITNSIFSTMLCHFTFNGIQVTLSKVATLFSNSAKQADVLNSMTMSDKLNYLLYLFFVAAIFAAIIYLVVRAIAKGRRAEHNVNYEARDHEFISLYSKDTLEKEFMFNIPFVIMIIFYVFYIVKVS